MILNQWMLPELSYIVAEYLGRYKKDYDLNYLLHNDLCILFDGDIKNCNTLTACLSALYGQMNILQLLESKGIELDTSCVDHAIKGKHLNIVAYLQSKGFNYSRIGFRHAISNGFVELIRHSKYFDENPTIQLYSPIKNGHFEMVKFLIEEKKIKHDFVDLFSVLSSNNIELVKYFKKEICDVKDFTEYEHGIGSIEIYNFLIENNIKFSEHVIDYSCEYGNIELIKFLEQKGLKCGSYGLQVAIRYNCHNLIDYLLNKNCPCDDYCIFSAIEKNNMYVLKYIEKNYEIKYEIDIDNYFSYNAILERANLEMLMYLENKNKIKYIQRALPYAVINPDPDVFKYIESKGIECDLECINIAVIYGILDMVKYLTKKGLKCNKESFNYCKKLGFIEIVKFLQ